MAKIKTVRIALGLSQEEMARRVGLQSKGQYSRIERGLTPSIRVAIALETVSGGRLSAGDLNPDVALARASVVVVPEAGAA